MKDCDRNVVRHINDGRSRIDHTRVMRHMRPNIGKYRF